MPNKAAFILLFILGAYISLAVYTPVALKAQELIRSEFKVLVDSYHGNIIKPEELIAINNLNKTLNDMGGVIRVYTLNERIRYEHLLDIDLLVLTPPNGSKAFDDFEKQVIKDYVVRGGSLLILGVPLLNSHNFEKFNPVIINELLDSLFSPEDVSFFQRAGSPDVVVDYSTNKYGFIKITPDTVDNEDLQELIGDGNYLLIKSASLDKSPENVDNVITTPPTAIRVDQDNSLYYTPKGFTIYLSKKMGRGSIVITGFGQIFTNITINSTLTWFDLGNNSHFAVALLNKLIGIERWIVGTLPYTHLVQLLPLTFTVAGLCILATYPAMKRKDLKRLEKIEAKKREVRISELLKKIREEESKKKK